MTPSWVSFASLALLAGLSLALVLVVEMLFTKRWDPNLKVSAFISASRTPHSHPLQHCLVTGGSSGTGLALAKLLARKGAHVSIVARDPKRLQVALAELEVR